MDDDPLWLLRIQQGRGTSSSVSADSSSGGSSPVPPVSSTATMLRARGGTTGAAAGVGASAAPSWTPAVASGPTGGAGSGGAGYSSDYKAKGAGYTTKGAGYTTKGAGYSSTYTPAAPVAGAGSTVTPARTGLAGAGMLGISAARPKRYSGASTGSGAGSKPPRARVSDTKAPRSLFAATGGKAGVPFVVSTHYVVLTCCVDCVCISLCTRSRPSRSQHGRRCHAVTTDSA